MPELPPRPLPAVPTHVRVIGSASAWWQATGPRRAITGLFAVAAVIGAVWWMFVPAPAPAESLLPPTTSTPPATASATVVVHVAGAVRSPGVIELASTARVVDAVRAGGGALDGADLDRLNLAAPVSDGQRIYVPRLGEAVPAGPDAAATGPVNLNTADLTTLETLPGIGPATAAAIVAHRDRQGPFATVDELADVAGIGPHKLAALDGLVTV